MQYIVRLLLFYSVIIQSCKFQSPVISSAGEDDNKIRTNKRRRKRVERTYCCDSCREVTSLAPVKDEFRDRPDRLVGDSEP